MGTGQGGDYTEVTLDTVAKGALPEMFERELNRVLQNIDDPNTSPDAKRSISITISFLPHPDREGASTVAECVAKLAPPRPAAGIIYLGQRDRKLVAVTQDVRQGDAFVDSPSVRPLDPQRHEAPQEEKQQNQRAG